MPALASTNLPRMPKRKYTLLYYIGATLLWLLLLTACKRQTVYNHFVHTPLSGWEKNDTINFHIDTLTQGGNYIEELGLRINREYPFVSLQVIVRQEILPSHKTRNDTISCSLINQRGNPIGPGVSHYQYSYRLQPLMLNKGESLHVTIRHDMKREIIPGVTDIGFRLIRSDKP